MKSPGNYQAGIVHTGVLDADSSSTNMMDIATARQRLARELLHRRLKLITKGTIIIDEGDQLFQFGEQTPESLTAHVIVTHPDFYQAVAYNGSIGGGESYMRQHWHTPDLVSLVRIMVLNLSVLQGMDGGKSWMARLLNKVSHLRNRNTISGSKANIAAHYDLSNQFFETFLDPSMMYSAAVFEHDKQSLHEASLNKLSHICERLQLKPTDHLLEIGTGWGSMAIHAAKHYGCRVTSATISQEQYEYACKRVAEEGLQDQVEIILEDYRNLQGQYDKLVSIEMIEAVGHQYFSTYFAKCSALLKPDGLMLIQAITISDQRYERSLHSVDFIQRYIFPGGCLPCNAAIAHHVSKDTDLQIVGLEDITRDYAMTLERWRTTFLSKVKDIQDQGFGQDFIRMWDYYLAYCQGGFMERVIHTAQFLMAKPECRLQPLHARIPSQH